MRRCLNCMNEYSEECQDICPRCGYVDGKTQEGSVYLMPGSILQGRYIVGTVIMARDVDVIYNGWDALFERKVQIQEYFPKYCTTRAGKAEMSIYDAKQERYEEGLDLFYKQSRELIRLYKEEDIVTYHACFKENRTAYAILESRSVMTLEESLNGRPMRVKNAYVLLMDVIECVNKCHRIGVYHGLIDAKTFWRTGNGKLVLKDFGAWRYCSGEPGIVDYGKAGIHTDVYRIALLFCRLVTGREIEDGEKLEAELLKRSITMKSSVLAAIKRALSHDTKSLSQFRQEMYEGGRRKKLNTSVKRQRKSARNSLVLPRWVVGGAAVGVIVIGAFTVLVATGMVKLKIQSEENHLGQQIVRVPNVVKMDVEEAEKELKAMRLVLSKDMMEYSNEVEQNRIIYQSPKEGSTAKQGETVTVHISLGKEKALLPPVQGVSREEAETKLREAGFQSIRIREDVKTAGVYGSVLQIDVQAGQEAGEKENGARNENKNLLSELFGRDRERELDHREDMGEPIPLDTEIILVICMKEETVDLATDIEVPSVMGMEKSEANAVLEKQGFQINWVEEAGDEPPGTVVGQVPVEGDTAGEGSYVTVTVCKGMEKIYMKNVELMTDAEARTEIEKLGLVTGEVKKDYSGSVAAGKVISQDIAQGAEVKRGDAVNLVISLGRKPENSTKTTAPKKRSSGGAQPTNAATEVTRQSDASTEAKNTAEEVLKKKRESIAEEVTNRVPKLNTESQASPDVAEESEKPSESAGVVQAGPQGKAGEKPTSVVSETNPIVEPMSKAPVIVVE